jgi:hypothetical protein
MNLETLLMDYHPAEIGRLLNMTESEGKKLVRGLMLNDWGYKDWEPLNVGDGYALFCNGSEWIDANGDNLIFDTAQEAKEYIQEVTA